MSDRRQRLVDGPEHDLLTDEEMAEYLRISVDTLHRLVRKGEFPRPVEITDRRKLWLWRDALFWVLTIELRGRMGVEKDEPEKKS